MTNKMEKLIDQIVSLVDNQEDKEKAFLLVMKLISESYEEIGNKVLEKV